LEPQNPYARLRRAGRWDASQIPCMFGNVLTEFPKIYWVCEKPQTTCYNTITNPENFGTSKPLCPPSAGRWDASRMPYMFGNVLTEFPKIYWVCEKPQTTRYNTIGNPKKLLEPYARLRAPVVVLCLRHRHSIYWRGSKGGKAPFRGPKGFAPLNGFFLTLFS